MPSVTHQLFCDASLGFTSIMQNLCQSPVSSLQPRCNSARSPDPYVKRHRQIVTRSVGMTSRQPPPSLPPQLLQKFLHILRNPEVRHRIHNSPPMTTILSHIKRDHARRSLLCIINSNVTLPPTPTSSKKLYPSRSHTKPL